MKFKNVTLGKLLEMSLEEVEDSTRETVADMEPMGLMYLIEQIEKVMKMSMMGLRMDEKNRDEYHKVLERLFIIGKIASDELRTKRKHVLNEFRETSLSEIKAKATETVKKMDYEELIDVLDHSKRTIDENKRMLEKHPEDREGLEKDLKRLKIYKKAIKDELFDRRTPSDARRAYV